MPALMSDAFLDLVCSDADLLAAEFDAIVSVGWGAVPPGRPSGPPPVPEPARERPFWALTAGEVPQAPPRHGEPDPLPGRQRGPPRRGGQVGGGSR
jgi:hypothetical protein